MPCPSPEAIVIVKAPVFLIDTEVLGYFIEIVSNIYTNANKETILWK